MRCGTSTGLSKLRCASLEIVWVKPSIISGRKQWELQFIVVWSPSTSVHYEDHLISYFGTQMTLGSQDMSESIQYLLVRTDYLFNV